MKKVFYTIVILYLINITTSSVFSQSVPPGTLSGYCTGGATPRVILSWNDYPGADSNGLQKGDSYPNDPGSWWGWLPTTSMTQRSYTDNAVKIGDKFEYRVKYTANTASNILRVDITISNCPGGNATPTPTPTPTSTLTPTPTPSASVSPTPSPNTIPSPNHPMFFGYYFDGGRYGDFREEVNCYTNYRNLPWPYLSNVELSDPPTWREDFKQSLAMAASDKKPVILSLEVGYYPNSAVNMILDESKPYWDKVIYIDLADEPGWNKAQTEAVIKDINKRLADRGLSKKPFGVTYTTNQVLNSDSIYATGLDWVGIEGYVNPPGGTTTANIAYLNSYVNQAKARVPAAKKIILVMQAYSRNYAWTNIQTLTDLQLPTYLLAYNDPRVLGIRMFSYGRASGTREYPTLKAVHEDIATAMGINTCGQVIINVDLDKDFQLDVGQTASVSNTGGLNIKYINVDKSNPSLPVLQLSVIILDQVSTIYLTEGKSVEIFGHTIKLVSIQAFLKNMENLLGKAAIAAGTGVMLSVSSTMAAGGYSFRINPPGQFKDFMQLVTVIIGYAYRVAIPIVVLVIVYAGAKMLLARGNPTEVSAAKSILWWAIVGLLIIVIGGGFISLINSILGIP